jgi:DNA-binding transcriptional LysR family regulator
VERILNERRKLLPLLPHLAVLLAERHISRAAARVGVTQPSMSRTLAAARRLLGDELLIRTSSGATLTPRGEELRALAASILQQVDTTWAKPNVVPGDARATVRFVATDYACQLFLPSLVAKLRREAPGINVDVSAWSADALRQLERDEAQLGVNPLEVAARGFYRQRVAQDRYVVALSARHPLARERLDLRRFTSAAHVLTVTEGGELGVVDRALRKKGKRRHVGVRVRDFTTTLSVVAESDMIATVPERLAQRMQAGLGLALHEAPLPLPPISVALIWHEARHHDPLLKWLRRVMLELEGRLSAGPP